MPKKLLLADDSVTIQRVIELTFSGEDIQVLAVGDGEEAITRIPLEKPDIVLADIGMPKRSGYEVCAFVKGTPELAHSPVLLLAGAFEPVDETKAKEARCDGVLVKPFEPQHVIARVRELISGAKGSPTQSAVQDIPRPAARLAPPRLVEMPKREDRPKVPDDLMDVGEADLEPRIEELQTPASEIVLDASLDDYFDKLDEAFSNIGGTSSSGAVAAARSETRASRPARPVLERDLESFDEPSLVDTAASPFVEAPRVPEADPFAGLMQLESEDSVALPTLDDLLADVPPPAGPTPTTFEAAPASTMFDPSPAPAPISHDAAPLERSSSRSVIADAFSALLAVEQGEPGATPVRLGGNGSALVVTEAMVDDLARRVIEKLALGSSDQLSVVVREIVSDVAERLVRGEIDRIRNQA
jgi:CheY-like chemotaxis protein